MSWNPCGEELRHLANSQHQFATQVTEPGWEWILNPQSSSQMTANPSRYLSATL